jgi:hypothetical protein
VLSLSGFQTKVLYTFLNPHPLKLTQATAHNIFLDLNILIIFGVGEEQKL